MLLWGKLKSLEKKSCETKATEAASCWLANNAVLQSQRTGLKWNLMGGCKGGGQNWTCQLLGQNWRVKRESRGKRREGRRQHVWCKVLRCMGKMTLGKVKGFLLLKPLVLQPPSVSLPSPNCVFQPVMKRSDRTSAQGLTFPWGKSKKVTFQQSLLIFRVTWGGFPPLPSVCKQ